MNLIIKVFGIVYWDEVKTKNSKTIFSLEKKTMKLKVKSEKLKVRKVNKLAINIFDDRKII